MAERVKLVEVGPRDGLQNEKKYIETADKLQLIQLLIEAGLKNIEVTSFVKPSAISQMKDSQKLFTELKTQMRERFNDFNFPVLVPNEKGLDNALVSGVREIALFTATSNTFTQKNINASIEESFKRFIPIAKKAKEKNIKMRGYISTAFYCPYEGKIKEKQVITVLNHLFDLGIYEVSIGDTIGMATPNEVESLINLLKKEIPLKKLAMHFHDTRGMGIANILKSLDLGVRVFDASIGGLGGCPYAQGASGNVATEEVVFLLHRLGFKTGIDFDKLHDAARYIMGKIPQAQGSKLLRAL